MMEDYTPDMDQMLFYLPLAGSTFKKCILMRLWVRLLASLYLQNS